MLASSAPPPAAAPRPESRHNGMPSQLGGPLDPLPSDHLGLRPASIPQPIGSHSGCSGRLGVSEGGVGEVVGKDCGPGNPLRPPRGVQVGLTPFLHRARIRPVLRDGNLGVSVDGPVPEDVREGEQLTIADGERASLLIPLVRKHPDNVGLDIVIECCEYQRMDSRQLGLGKARLLPASKRHVHTGLAV